MTRDRPGHATAQQPEVTTAISCCSSFSGFSEVASRLVLRRLPMVRPPMILHTSRRSLPFTVVGNGNCST
jgi:hypothetical protein